MLTRQRRPFVFKIHALLVTLMLSPGFTLAQSIFTHIHMQIPVDSGAAEWHQTVLGGDLKLHHSRKDVEFSNGLIQVMDIATKLLPSQGGVIDHIGIAVEDVGETLELARAKGAQVQFGPVVGITAPVIGFFIDPWGSRVEVMEDPTYKGVNHIHLFANDADYVHDWFIQVFGGEDIPERGKGNFHTILYGDLWIQITQVEDDTRPPGPSYNRSLGHIGFSVPSLDIFIKEIESTGHKPDIIKTNGQGPNLIFFEGPEGILFEVSEIINP